MSDEEAIRELQRNWMQATIDGDAASVEDLMTDDVVFLTPGRPPFGKPEFMETFRAMAGKVSLSCVGSYEEVVVAGDVAYTRARLDISVIPKGGDQSKELGGYALSVVRRCSDGKWRMCRDANLVTAK